MGDKHLRRLAQSGISHVHLLPTFVSRAKRNGWIWHLGQKENPRDNRFWYVLVFFV